MRLKRRLFAPLLAALGAVCFMAAHSAAQDASERMSHERDLILRAQSPDGSLIPQSTADCTAGTVSCGGTRTGMLSTTDCGWYGVAAGQAYISYVDTYDFTGVAGTTITVTYSSSDIPSADLLLIISTPPDSAGNFTSLARRWGGGSVSYTIPSSGLYNINASSRSLETGHYTLIVTCSSGGGTLNLAPYQLAGSSDKIVVSTTVGTTTDSTTIRSTDTLYVDYAVLNFGPSSTQVAFTNELYLDGMLKRTGTADPPLAADYYVGTADYAIGPLSVGTHTLRLKADAGNSISETNESDNEYTKTFTVSNASSPGGCSPTTTTLCLNASRFRVSVAWRVPSQGTSGVGTAVGMSGDTGNFWFFSSSNTELVVKVLDGRAVTGHFWVFYGALSDVEYTITVTDTLTGVVKTYFNPSGRMASVGDTSAF